MSNLIPGVVTEHGGEAYGQLVQAPDAAGRGYYLYVDTCHRCGGMGGSNAWAHTGWTCYRCGGTGREAPRKVRIYTPEAYSKLQARRETLAKTQDKAKKRKAQAAFQALQASLAEFEAAHPGLAEQLALHAGKVKATGGETFLAALNQQLTSKGSLSDLQIAAAVASLERESVWAAERAAKTAASRHLGAVGDVVELTVRNVKTIDLSYGTFPTIYRYLYIMETDDGQAVRYVGISEAVPHSPDAGWVKVKAKIKKLDEYRGTLQTVIERPRTPK